MRVSGCILTIQGDMIERNTIMSRITSSGFEAAVLNRQVHEQPKLAIAKLVQLANGARNQGRYKEAKSLMAAARDTANINHMPAPKPLS